jgi:hypothetical protein
LAGHRIHILGVLVGLLLAGLACQLPAGTSGQVDPTVLAQALIDANNATVVAGLTQTAPLPAPESPVEAEGTATPTETATLAATIPTSPSALLTENTHCRTGPLAVHDLVITYLNGQLLDILGKNAAGDYWFVANPNNSSANCWLWGRYAQVSGDTSLVPVFTPPPSPTPAWLWAGTWTIWFNDGAVQMSQVLTHSGSQIGGYLAAPVGNLDLAGTTSAGGRDASGVFDDEGEDTYFQWHMLDNGDQFIGKYYTDAFPAGGSYCGARNGSPRPVPCLWP